MARRIGMKGALLLAALWLVACAGPKPTVAIDLLTLPATSRVVFEHIEVGTGRGQQHLRQGWPFPPPGVTPSSQGLRTTGPEAQVRFCLLLPCELAWSASYTYQGQQPTEIVVTCNDGLATARSSLRPGQGTLSLTFPEKALRPGLNHFTLSLPPAAAELTVWHSFSLRQGNDQAREEERNLVMERGAVRDYYFRSPPQARLQGEVVLEDEGEPLVVELATGATAPRQLTIEASGRFDLDLALPADRPCRLSLRSSGEVQLVAPAITGSPLPAEAPPVSPPADLPRRLPPLVLLLCVDTLRADALSQYGAGADASPALGGADFATFQRARAQSGWTKSAVASVFTGRTVLRHQVLGFADKLSPDEVTLAESLQSLGYRTVGLTANRWTAAEFGFDQGFDRYETLPSARADQVLDVAIAAIEQHQAEGKSAQPLFLSIHLLDPHDPYQPPAAFFPAGVNPSEGSEKRLLEVEGELSSGRTVQPGAMANIRALYAGEVRFVDHELGRLWEFLKTAELYEPALIMLYSDHGEAFGEHFKMRHGNSLLEELLWVPWLVKLPSTNPAVSFPWQSEVEQIDMMPTLLGQLGAAVPDPVEGVDLSVTSPRELARRVSLGFLKYAAEDGPLELQAVPWSREYESATGYGFKLHVRRFDSFSPRLPLLQLFELDADPAERRDLSHEGRVELGFLWAELQAARQRAGPPAPRLDGAGIKEVFRSLPYLH